ncbi:hypothetical protein ATCV1_z757L [Acanthocystis turfacea chlorella virus 1]|uniref:Uncharacterized protein z757L n=1 Tax=Chlorovirus heliozoae TaxID=322019 RepID=A7KA17_9PHYC|nr:hypothetical protein ATCV1_z757L [Acanthocystis turfacea chlorella virus 1]ABT16891.1 hypothetical protein ATCV1_z757L [Acanthocystis turfacea chlorella virus 1]
MGILQVVHPLGRVFHGNEVKHRGIGALHSGECLFGNLFDLRISIWRGLGEIRPLDQGRGSHLVREPGQYTVKRRGGVGDGVREHEGQVERLLGIALQGVVGDGLCEFSYDNTVLELFLLSVIHEYCRNHQCDNCKAYEHMHLPL